MLAGAITSPVACAAAHAMLVGLLRWSAEASHPAITTPVASRLTLVVVIRGTMCAEVQFTFRVAIIVIATVTAKPIFLNGGCHLFLV